MDNIHETTMDWLRDAHAMEQQAEQMLSMFANRLENYPELKSRIEDHSRVAVNHQKLLQGCLERAGESPSAIKDIGAKVMGFGQSISGVMVSDEVVKGMMATYVFTQMEIVSYNILAAAAVHSGDAHLLAGCNQILAEEVAMSEWLQNHIPQITSQYISRMAQNSDRAKR